MLNVHLNGDVVRCPDISAIAIERNALRYQNNICKYGFKEDKCKAWQNSRENWETVKNLKSEGRCKLSGSILCPEHNKRVDQGNREKTFKITNVEYRKCADSALYMIHESEYKTLFITLTFPPFKGKHKLTKYIFEHEILNVYFSRFMENLRKNYNCTGYIGVREFGKKNNRVHYHLLLSMPYITFRRLNDTWCNTISSICNFAPNAISSNPKKRVINDPVRAMKYVCKYISKSKGQESSGRLIFISNNILQKARKMDSHAEIGFLDSFKFDYQKQTSDFTTCYRITEKTEMARFYDEFIFPFFELSVKKTENFERVPLNSS